MSENQILSAVAIMLMLAWVGSGLARRNLGGGKGLQFALGWLAIFAVAFLIFSALGS